MTETQRDRAENDLAVLHPDADLTIGGETITVRELRFLEGLQLHDRLRPLMADLDEALREDVSIATLEALFVRHMELMQELLALATGKPVDWIHGLSDADGYQLLLTWWNVNSGFFMRRLMADIVSNRHVSRLMPGEEAPSNGAPSTAH